MGRFFNTSGPCVAERHYRIDPLSRLENVRKLVDDEKYFILHAPRQTGKSTTIIALMEQINAEGRFVALYVNVENAQPMRNNVIGSNRIFMSSTMRHAKHYLPKEYWPSPECFHIVQEEEAFSVIDLGLMRRGHNGLAIANPIYQEVIPRELTSVEQDFLPEDPRWYVLPDGKLDIEKLLTRFIAFYKENGEMITKRQQYTESAHHLTFMAWLQRIVNGGGYIRREYGLGLKFIDLVIEYGGEKFAFELKTEARYNRATALEQIAAYAKRLSVQEAYLMVFRRNMTDPERVGEREAVQHGDLLVHLIWV
jgi:hypothetical protein